MGVADYFLNNYIMVYELLGLLIMLEISVHISEKDRRLSFVIIALLALESVVFYLEKWTQTFAQLSIMRPMLTAVLYSIYPVIMLIEMMIFSARKISGKKLLLLLLPEIISVPLYFTSQWTHIICYYTDDNHYMGGALNNLPYLVFGFYLIVFIINNVILSKAYSKVNRIIVLFLIIGPMLGVIYYIYFDFGRDYCELFTSAILLFFVYNYISMARIDPLTSLLNRQSYYKDADVKRNQITGVVSVDMNELKYINDNYGHEAGDKALKTVADILAKYCGKKGAVYRVGGDEFVILFFGVSEDTVLKNIEKMRQKLAEVSYSCAFGYAEKKLIDSVENTLVTADKRMFEDKAAIKKAYKEKGKMIHIRD